jgi:hypothetical protein
MESQRLLTVTEFTQKYSWPPLGGLRHIIFHAETNGFNKVIRRVGRRVLINEASFFEWVEEQNANQENK